MHQGTPIAECSKALCPRLLPVSYKCHVVRNRVEACDKVVIDLSFINIFPGISVSSTSNLNNWLVGNCSSIYDFFSFREGMSFVSVSELLNILKSSLIRLISSILRFKVQSRVPDPPGHPKMCIEWYKFENQND